MKGLSLIKDQGRFQVILMFTVMKRNVESLLPLLKLCEDLGIEGLIVERFIPWGRGKGSLGEVLNQDQWKEMVKTLLDSFSIEMEDDHPIPYQAFQISFHKDGQELLGAPCVIGVDGLCIMPEGIVFPCRRLPIDIGNLREDSLKTLWAGSELLEKLRRKENLEGKCCRCGMEGCRGCRSLALCLTGNVFAEDPHCWFEIK
jgi:MoaA/NifB/PqqE/SkfB family radical SAM enzyme